MYRSSPFRSALSRLPGECRTFSMGCGGKCGKFSAWRSLAVTCPRRSLAVTCGHSSGCRLCAATIGHLRSLAVTRVAASGCKWLRHLLSAVTCGHLRSLEWLRVAASGCVTCSRRSLAVTRVAASGCKWLIFPKSNTAQLACSMVTERVTLGLDMCIYVRKQSIP